MGIGSMGLQFLLLGRRRQVRFDRTLTIGRQDHFVDAWWVKALFDRFGVAITEEQAEQATADRFSEGIFRALGASVSDSLDASDFEQANIIHDLNMPIPRSLKHRYTLVADFGTIEHVFNIPVGLKNLIDMVELGGHFMAISPTNNMMGHGFYQLSPELYFNFLSRNGFSDIEVYILPFKWTPRLFRVTDPRKLQGRVELCNAEAVQVGVIARKVRHVDEMVVPIQSDYEQVFWKGRDIDRRKMTQAETNPKTAAAMADLRERLSALLTWPETLSPEFTFGLENSLHYEPVDPAVD